MTRLLVTVFHTFSGLNSHLAKATFSQYFEKGEVGKGIIPLWSLDFRRNFNLIRRTVISVILLRKEKS